MDGNTDSTDGSSTRNHVGGRTGDTNTSRMTGGKSLTISVGTDADEGHDVHGDHFGISTGTCYFEEETQSGKAEIVGIRSDGRVEVAIGE